MHLDVIRHERVFLVVRRTEVRLSDIGSMSIGIMVLSCGSFPFAFSGKFAIQHAIVTKLDKPGIAFLRFINLFEVSYAGL